MGVDFETLALAPCFGAFGQSVIYTPGAGAPMILTGIFNRYSVQEKIDANTGLVSTISRPTLALRVADLPPGVSPCQGEGFLAEGATWVVGDPPEYDGFGQMLLRLKRPQ